MTDARILLASEGMIEMADAAANGRVDEAQVLFFSLDAHNLTHDIDTVLRPADPELARDLCQRVIVIENQMAGVLDEEVVEREARGIAGLLDEARGVIAAASPLSPSSLTLDPCENALGAVTSEPLTAERLNSVIGIYEDIARDVATAPEDEVRGSFLGEAHNLAHVIDGPLRRADEALALQLCRGVLQIEREFAGGYDVDVISSEAASVARSLEDAGLVLEILE